MALLLSAFSSAWAVDAPSPASPQLGVTLTLEREDLKAGESHVPVQVWLVNPSEVPIGETEAWLEGPEFIHLVAQPGHPPVDHLTLVPSLAPHRDFQGRFWLHVDPKVREGDYNLLFGFRYHTPAGGQDVSLVTVEKKVQLGVLGTESVGGFSLRLVALLLPGMLLWMVLQVFHIGGAIQSAFDKGALAVLTSLLLVAFVTLRPPSFLAGGMSMKGLLFLCVLGAGLGLAIGLLIVLLRKILRKAARDRIVQSEDDNEEVLRKLLALATGGASARVLAWLVRTLPEVPSSSVLRNQAIQLKDGRQLSGCLFGPAAEGFVLVGSYRVGTADPTLRKKLTALQEEGKWSELLNSARQAGLTPMPDIPVLVKTGEAGAKWQKLKPVYRLSVSEIASRSAASEGPEPVSVTP